jgi:hypothetical protein
MWSSLVLLLLVVRLRIHRRAGRGANARRLLLAEDLRRRMTLAA